MLRSQTDSDLSLAADEFVWTQAGDTECHRYILPPLLRQLKATHAKKILDLGCGNGALSGRLDREGFLVTGIDASRSGIAVARQSNPKLDFRVGSFDDALASDLAGRFDAVICIEVLEHLLLPRLAVKRAAEALRASGRLYVSTPYHGYVKNLVLAATNKFDKHWHPLRDFGHVKFFSRATLTQLLTEEGLAISSIARVGRLSLLAKSILISGEKKAPLLD